MSAESRVRKVVWPVFAFAGGVIFLAVMDQLWPYLRAGNVPPLKVLGVSVVLVVVLVACTIAVALDPIRKMVIEERKNLGDCLKCGYSRGVSERCPECGSKTQEGAHGK